MSILDTIDPLRPQEWTEFIGQEPLKRELFVSLEAAKQEDRACRPILLIGRPGFGKTSMAQLLARTLGVPLVTFVCPFQPTIVSRSIRQPALLFFDELHRSAKKDQEALLTLLEDGKMIFGRREIRANRITIVGATTEPQKLLTTVTDRFPLRPSFSDYSDSEMAQIVQGMCQKLDLDYPEEDCAIFGRSAAGVPRVAKSLVMTAADLTTVNGKRPSPQEVLALKRIRLDGLGVEHCNYLRLLLAQEGTASLTLISAAMGLPTGAIQEIERLLIQKGLLLVGPRGRSLSDLGWTWVDDNPEEASA